MLAYHYLDVLGLARAARRDTRTWRPGPRTALQHAGDRALGLNAFATAGRRSVITVCWRTGDDASPIPGPIGAAGR
jgi:hypothetical protein